MAKKYDVAAYVWPAYTGAEAIAQIGFDSMSHYQFCHFTNIDREYNDIMQDVVKEWARIDKAFTEQAKSFADAHSDQPPLVTINSWNEWTETSCLEPDDLYGYGYLDAVKQVFGGRDTYFIVS